MGTEKRGQSVEVGERSLGLASNWEGGEDMDIYLHSYESRRGGFGLGLEAGALLLRVCVLKEGKRQSWLMRGRAEAWEPATGAPSANRTFQSIGEYERGGGHSSTEKDDAARGFRYRMARASDDWKIHSPGWAPPADGEVSKKTRKDCRRIRRGPG